MPEDRIFVFLERGLVEVLILFVCDLLGVTETIIQYTKNRLQRDGSLPSPERSLIVKMDPFLNSDFAHGDRGIFILFLRCILNEDFLIANLGLFLHSIHIVLRNGPLFGSVGKEIDGERGGEAGVFSNELFNFLFVKVF